MFYAIMCSDNPDSLDARLSARPAHLQRLDELKNEGRLLLAGPFPAIDNIDPGASGFTGSLIVAEFDSLDIATQWANADPYVKSNVYADITIKPFKHVLP